MRDFVCCFDRQLLSCVYIMRPTFTHCVLAALFYRTLAIPIDNGVEGQPEIECGADSITVSFNTRNPFEGKLGVFHHFLMPGCQASPSGGRVATMRLPFDTCGLQRIRSLNPRGIYVRTTVGIQFHPLFVTKVDQAFRIQCFYMEADKSVSQELEVSQLTTEYQSQQVPMPICRYEILDTSPFGPPIRFAIVGQAVYHKWVRKLFNCMKGLFFLAQMLGYKGCFRHVTPRHPIHFVCAFIHVSLMTVRETGTA